MPRSLNITSLRLLLAVIEEKNLARAAARENIAPSAVSRRIQDLELRFGVMLLHRHDRGVEPTPAALMVVERIRSALSLVDQISEDLGKVRDGSGGLVRIHAHATAASGLLPGLLRSFLDKHPQIEVTVVEATSVEILVSIRHGVCDVGLLSGTIESSDVELIPWVTDELVAVLPVGHPLAASSPPTLEAMLPYPFITMQRDSALVALVRGHARALGKPLVVRAHVTSFEVAAKMVAKNLGVAILPVQPAQSLAEHYGAIVRPLAEPWANRPLAICLPDVKRPPAAARALVDFLRNQRR